MSSSVYTINKGINKPIEFKGLKGQYIWYMAAGLVILFIFFAAMYIVGINAFVCMAVIVIAGTCLIAKIYGLSNKYGEYGMLKKIARRNIPALIKSSSRKIFIHEK